MRRTFIVFSFLSAMLFACEGKSSDEGGVIEPVMPPDSIADNVALARRNLVRAIAMTDAAMTNYFSDAGMAMSRYYNPYTGVRSTEIGSVWHYTSSIETLNAVMHGLKALRDGGDASLYNQHFDRYKAMMRSLFDNAAYYRGQFTLTSYTQTKEWWCYGVNRANAKNSADVGGGNMRNNVYDDQMWLIRELIEAYRLTGEADYLSEAEYLTAYVLDGWDCTLNISGNENGGIPWGPGYVSMHSCSNGPIISPLVWLHELYKDKPDQISYLRIATDGSRVSVTAAKKDYYLAFAQKVYAYMRANLYNSSSGCYIDNLNSPVSGGGNPEYETVGGVNYRKHTPLSSRNGPDISYNSGTMLSGAADLYRATNDANYHSDASSLAVMAFTRFARPMEYRPDMVSYATDGFNIWFNGVLMRGWADVHSVDGHVPDYLGTFQRNLDFGWYNFLYKDMLPRNLQLGWDLDNAYNNMESMFTFAMAAEYAVLAKFQLER
ncbi:MAG: glycoside hydrolase family 76 protein [Rikenellaceae bacterium]|jgi:hypothetical protein|nr:glycoside hydrolase family 76 protein [Rikenellaceae bacterium]